MEGFKDSERNEEYVNNLLGEMRAKNEQRHTSESLEYEEGLYAEQVASLREASGTLEVNHEYTLQIHNAESSLHFAARYRMEGDIGRAAESLSFADIQIKRAKSALYK